MIGIIFALISNLVAILVTERFINGFTVTHEPFALAIVVILFAIANSVILPMVRFILKPLIWLTLGFLGFILNGVMIYLVDTFSDSVTINGFLPLFYATIIIGVINATIAYGARVFKK